MNPYDLYEDLTKEAEWIYKNVNPPIKTSFTNDRKDIQEEITSFFPKEQKKYTQNWKTYYQTCRNQKQLFFQILKDASDYLDVQQEYNGNGRPAVKFPDIIKSLVIKSNFNLSSWGIESELKYALSSGLIDNLYKKTSITKYLNSPLTTKYLHELYKIIALPVIPLEIGGQYATDASGISHLFKNKKWVEVRLEKQEHKTFSKLHVIIGTLTGTVITAKVTEGRKHESPLLPELLDEASQVAKMKEVSADSGYLSRKNCDAIASVGAKPFIKPKKNVKSLNLGSSGSWGEMIRFWKQFQPLFATHYHRRSNVEAFFGSLKKKWMDYCRCKLPVAQENEILSKIVCYNIWILSQALFSSDIQPVFMEN